jgi:predicted nucleotidyltransferase component of viral defense system
MLDLKQIESFYPHSLRAFKRNLLREYLQYKTLEVIFASEFAGRLFFKGGTAIHMIHANPRFSEDLDFDNLRLTKNEFIRLTVLVKKKLALEGYDVEVKNSFQKAHHAYLRISGLLYDSGLSGHREEKLMIQIDTEPQAYRYSPDKVVINKFDVVSRINVVPADTLLSQKIYAILLRRRPMGRDFYDAIFLFGKTKPDFVYLRQKLGINNTDELVKRLLDRCRPLNFGQLAKDVEQFLFVPGDAKKILLFTDYVRSLRKESA